MHPNKAAEILAMIPQEAWDHIWRQEPEACWDSVPPRGWTPQAFIGMMIMAGLNDYQLRQQGPAERIYWSELRRLVKEAKPPETPEQLHNIMRPFYGRTYSKKVKLARLRKFLQSPLAHGFWRQPVEQIAPRVNQLLDQIAFQMGQGPTKKTILFSIKTLAISLRLLGYDIQPETLIPVDEHIRNCTHRLMGYVSDWEI